MRFVYHPYVRIRSGVRVIPGIERRRCGLISACHSVMTEALSGLRAMRTRWWLVTLALAATVLASGCTHSGVPDQPTGASVQPTEASVQPASREPIALGSASISADDRTLSLSSDTCNRSPSVDVVEKEDRVVITSEANTTTGNSQLLCENVFTVQLNSALAGRQVVDGTTGRSIPVRPV
jgi:hypothetical protein